MPRPRPAQAVREGIQRTSRGVRDAGRATPGLIRQGLRSTAGLAGDTVQAIRETPSNLADGLRELAPATMERLRDPSRLLDDLRDLPPFDLYPQDPQDPTQIYGPRLPVPRPGGYISSSGFNGCEAWICFTDDYPGGTLPNNCIQYRIPGCRTAPPDAPRQPPPQLPRDAPRPYDANPFEDGWIEGCQYFVFIGSGGDPIFPGGDGVWDRYGAFNGWVFPCWGPIVGVTSEVFIEGGGDFYTLAVYLDCGGIGHVPGASVSPAYRPKVPTARSRFDDWVFRTRNERPSFLDRPVPNIESPVDEMWVMPAGARVDTLGTRTDLGRGFHRYIIVSTTYQRTDLEEDRPFTPYFYDIRRAADIEPYRNPRTGSTRPWGMACAAPVPPPPPPPLRDDEPMCNCDDISRLIDRKLRPIYKILGFPQNENPSTTLNPEELIKALGAQTYSTLEPKEIAIGNLKDLGAALVTALYHRSGLHRLPANVPQYIFGDDSVQVDLPDMVSFQEWMIKQLDGILGSFPIKVNVQQEDGSDQEIKIDSVSDGFAELAGLLMAIGENASESNQYASRAMIEAARASNAALISQDYAKANAQYLGYRGNTVMRQVQATFTPPAPPPPPEQDSPGGGGGSGGSSGGGGGGGSTPPAVPSGRQAMNPSTQNVPGWQWDGDDSLQDTLNQLLVGVGIIKAALVQKYEQGGRVTGDAIRQDLDRDGVRDSDEWQAYLNSVRNPSPARQIDNAPPVEIRDISESQR